MNISNKKNENEISEKISILLERSEKITEENNALRTKIQDYEFKIDQILKLLYRQAVNFDKHIAENCDIKTEIIDCISSEKDKICDKITGLVNNLEEKYRDINEFHAKEFEAQNIRLNQIQKEFEAQNIRLNQIQKESEAQSIRLNQIQKESEAQNIRLNQIQKELYCIKKTQADVMNKFNNDIVDLRYDIQETYTVIEEQEKNNIANLASEILQIQNDFDNLKEGVNQIKNQKHIDSEYQRKKLLQTEKYVLSVWNLEGASSKLINLLEKWRFAEGNITDVCNLIYLCCIFEHGQEELALVGLKKYIAEKGEDKVLDFLPLAWLAWENGIGGDYIKKAAYIFKELENNRREKTLKKYLETKSFIIIGNSPSILGTGKGEWIDKKDIVIRMNTYQLKDEFVQDTGKKITAFADNSNFATINHKNHYAAKNLDLIYIPCDFWHIKISQFCVKEKFIDSYYDILLNGKAKVVYFEPQDSIELKQILKIISPSCGMAIFWSVYKIFGYVSREWFIGFSDKFEKSGIYENPMKDKGDEEQADLQKANLDSYSDRDELSTFYKNAPIYAKGQGHNFNRELRLRNEIFEKSDELLR